jgi:FlgD Ig-like domain
MIRPLVPSAPLRRLLVVLAVAAALLASPRAHAQSFNVDFGPPGSTPPAGFGAAGIPGVWNTVGVLSPGARQPLVDVQGQSGAVNIYMIGGTAMLDVDDPATLGDDGALLDDMLIGFNNPIDVCVWIENLVNGNYEVVTYAITPNEPSRDSRVTVDFSPVGPTFVGGTFAGTYASELTHARHTVHVTTGKIGLHSGLQQSLTQSGINGVQVRPVPLVDVGPSPFGALRAAPNPSAGEVEFRLAAPAAGATLTITDVMGREVLHSALTTDSRGTWAALWDGRDVAGARVVPGLYFARIADARGAALGPPLRIVRLR